MKIKKAIKVLQEIQLQFENSILESEIGDADAVEAREDNQEAIKAIEIAIEALEKQTAKKPSIVGMQNKCPNIDCFESALRYYSYCLGCGQKLDWGEVLE